ncbi:unnamed protein product [Prunus armeniaca]
MQGSAGSYVACSEKRMSRRQHCRKVQGSAGSYVGCSEKRRSRRQHAGRCKAAPTAMSHVLRRG